ncbi:LacI family transcriptional regulator [bacterium A37T11]|nr:LacI family transcriptional regulator [bacterium A37T11]
MVYKVILLLDFAEEYSKELLKGINTYAKQSGNWLFCKMPLFHRETIGMPGILNWAKEWGAHGIIGQLYNVPEIEQFLEAGIPVIAQDFKERFSNIPNITGSYKETGELAASYFIKKGFVNFAFYGFKNIVWSRERAEGFDARLAKANFKVHYFEHELAPRRELWYYKPSALSRWLKSLPKPVAILACDDNQAQQITEACRLLQIRIPEEIAVLGVDNDEIICDLSDPPLSSIELNAELGGYEAARTMENMIRDGRMTAPDIFVKPLQIKTRQSTDIYATNDTYIASSLKYIHQNIEKRLQVPDVLKQVPISRRVLEKRFFECTGLSIYKYISALRMEKFAEKVLQCDQPINEIALELGFDDSKNVARQFKQAYGCSPLEFRKQQIRAKQ